MIVDQVAPEAPQPTSSVSRLRAIVIAAVLVLAAGIGLVLGMSMMKGTGSGLATAASYVPAGAVTYMEADLSLSPSQQDALGAILARFPGDKQTMLGDALAQTLDEELAKNNAPFDYSNDIAPWFDGTVAIAVLDVPFDAGEPQPPSVAALVGVTDPAAAAAFGETLRGTMGESGGSFTSSESHGFTIWEYTPDTTNAEVSGEDSFAYTVTDDQVVLGNGRAAVEALLAVHDGGDSLAGRDDVSDLTARLPEDRAGVMTVNIKGFMQSMRDQMGANDTQLRDLLDEQLATIPDVAVASLAFEDDAIRVDGATTVPTVDPAPVNTSRSLAASVPNDAIFFVDAPNLGANASAQLKRLRDQLQSSGAQDELDQLQQIEAGLGGPIDELFDWIGGGAVAAGWDGEQPYVGIVLEVTDAGAAEDRLRQLGNLLNLATMDPSAEVKITTETVAGVKVTSIRFTTTTPKFSSDASEMEAVVQYAMDGDHVLIGVGDRFVSRALQLAAGDSLADDPRFTDAVARFGGGDNAGSFYLDLAALRATVEAQAGEMLPPEYATEIQPYLAPLDLLVGVTRVEGDAMVTRYGVVLR